MGERVHRGQIQNLVNWEKYDQSFDTWEPRENILDKWLLKGFHKTVDVTVDVQDLLHALREAVVQALMGLKRPEASVEVPVPLAALGPLARAIFELARRPPSRRGRGPLLLVIDVGAQWKSTQLQLDMPEDIAWLLQLHQLRPDNAYGCAVLKQGKSSNNNMLILGAPVLLSFYEPVRKQGVFKAGASFSVTGNVWVFNGATGALMPAAGLPNATMHAPLAEYLKGVLRGRAAWGFKHKLAEKWAELPKARLELTAEEALPKARVKRARAGPSTGGEQPPHMADLDA